MANELSARAIDPEVPSEDEYQALCAALSASARGRAFLAEYARRQRAADTAMLIAAIERLESLMRSQAAPQPPPAQASEEATSAEPAGEAAEAEPPVEAPSDATGNAETPSVAEHDLTPSHVQIAGIPEVGWFNEQPASMGRYSPSAIPAPHAATALAIGAVIEAAAAATADEPAAPKMTVFKAGTIPPPPPFAGEDFAQAEADEAAAPQTDPLALIMALSEDERLALFT